MVTGGHGVRMQSDYTHDTPGKPGAVSVASPRWLRLTRSGDTITASESTDGAHWDRIGTTRLAGLPVTAQVGLFVTSPQLSRANQHLPLVTASAIVPTQATGVFDELSLHRASPGVTWTGEGIGVGGGGYPAMAGEFHQAAGGFTLRGSGDIAPQVGGAEGVGLTIDDSLAGVFAGMIVVIVLATLFITTEFRRGLIRTTLAASPRRGRVLAAKAIVIGAVTFVAGLAGTAVSVPVGLLILRANHNFVHPAGALTQMRVIVGTAALLAVVALVALAAGAILRRSAGAVTAVIVTVVLPYYVVLPALPDEAGRWLMRVTPAAAFTVQRALPEYPQVSNPYIPADGYYPLAPWAGLAVLCAYAVLAPGLAVLLLRRRDA
jgi:hypothetical protein